MTPTLSFAVRLRGSLSRALLLGALFALNVIAARGAERVLVEFREGLGAMRPRTADAAVRQVTTRNVPVLRVDTGTRESWPGVTFVAPARSWDLHDFGAVVVRLRNVGAESAKIFCRVDNPGADGTRNCLTGDTTLAPGKSGSVRIELRAYSGDTLGGKLFGMRGYPVKAGGDGTLDPARVNQVLLFVSQPTQPQAFEVESISATGAPLNPLAWTRDADPFLPCIDTFGQYRHRPWPGKVTSLEDLHQRREGEARELAQEPPARGWDAYGGWAEGPQLEATGFFRVQKHGGRWWFVDPAGHLFWSHGVDCVLATDDTPIEEREAWFENSPAALAEFAEFLRPREFALKGHFAGRSPRSFSFAGANLRRKYGSDWRKVVSAVVHQRLRHWGVNTIGNWSSGNVTALRRTAYTDSLDTEGAPMIEGSEGYWGKFPDVFDPAFVAAVRRAAAGKKGASANDPWCLGYFSHNEMSWGDEVSLAEAALRSPPTQPAKHAFLAHLRQRYADLAALNTAWGTSHATWDALLQTREVPERTRARADLEAFYSALAEQYFRSVRDVLREVAPHQLYLGCRFAWANARAAAAAAKYCDVVSYNLYVRSVADFVFNGGADVPLLIGEFHFGALDRGLFHTGLVPVANQAERAAAYRDYVEGALRHPQFVGTHWFQWQDEPTTGRVYDEENYQIGWVDIADTPYPETVAALRQIGDTLYRTRASTPPGAGR